MSKLWGGRFSQSTAEELENFSESISFDKRLSLVDIEGSIAHANMLHSVNIVTEQEKNDIIVALNDIKEEIKSGKFLFDIKLEDIHMAIESRLIELIGDPGKKLHTARSRNDQVALDTRLYLKYEIEKLQLLLLSLKNIIVNISENNIYTIMPGYTHMQRAQVISLAHHLMAYYCMFKRDNNRLSDVKTRILQEMPLGSGALAGTTLPIDRDFVTSELDFNSPSLISIDSVSDRDYIIEFNSACAIIMVHLSRMAEELILWNTREFGFIEIADKYATGSSMMPQKKNPDVPELIRGKSARVIGNLIQILTLIKGTPLSYNRDFQEDKESFFDSLDTTKSCLSMLGSFLQNITFNKANMAEATKNGFLNATEAMEYLIKKDIPNRDAHHIIGKAVAYCSEQNKNLEDLSTKEWITFADNLETIIGDDIKEALSLDNCLLARTSQGGPSPVIMKKVINQAKLELNKQLNE